MNVNEEELSASAAEVLDMGRREECGVSGIIVAAMRELLRLLHVQDTRQG